MMYSPKPIPESPTHCTDCGEWLPLLRRWGGKCKHCVAEMHRAHPTTTVDPIASRWTELGRFSKRNRQGINATFVRVRCACGTERVMSLTVWNQRRTRECRRCLMRGLWARGVESDYAR